MIDINDDSSFDVYRAKYIKCLEQEIFPWEPAYYYYVSTVKRIDVFDFEQFKDDILEKNSLCSSIEESNQKYTYPMYIALDEFYQIAVLETAEGEFIKLC